jgi:hypothetical protein
MIPNALGYFKQPTPRRLTCRPDRSDSLLLNVDPSFPSSAWISLEGSARRRAAHEHAAVPPADDLKKLTTESLKELAPCSSKVTANASRRC